LTRIIPTAAGESIVEGVPATNGFEEK
jgi:hypothetical protein